MVTGMRGDHASSALAGSRFGDLRWVESTGSTNADLLALAAEDGADGVVLVAEHQTAGRGRLDRRWEAPAASSLLCSVLVRPQLPVGMVQLTALAAAVAASDACDAVAGVRPRVKWPNDLVIVSADGVERKLAGILSESSLRGGEVAAVVIGMGLNVNWPDDFPDELAGIATSLNHHAGRDVDREELLVAYLRGLEALLAGLDTADGRDALLLRYRHLSVTLGQMVRVELGSGSLSGFATDVSPEGHLLVELAGEVVEIAVGDVVHLRPTS
jgi:BirA family transcriptional regulator, biotin operon repressor / biotin---[acetyl-CoA-carboxylase] ligase